MWSPLVVIVGQPLLTDVAGSVPIGFVFVAAPPLPTVEGGCEPVWSPLVVVAPPLLTVEGGCEPVWSPLVVAAPPLPADADDVEPVGYGSPPAPSLPTAKIDRESV